MEKSGRLSNLVLQRRAVVVVRNVICHRQDRTKKQKEEREVLLFAVVAACERVVETKRCWVNI